MERLLEYLNCVEKAAASGGLVRGARSDFYLVCPCCKSQTQLPPFDDAGHKICFAPSSVGVFKFPFDPVYSAGYKDYFELVAARQTGNFPYLLEAYRLYKGTGGAYAAAFAKFGDDMFILSSCWGLVSAKFKLPCYNFEFSVRQKRQPTPTPHTRYINYDGCDTCNAWLNTGFFHLAQPAFENPLKPVVIVGGQQYIRRFKYLYSVNGLQNPVIALVGEDKMHSYLTAAKPKNWHIKRIGGYTNWQYWYMKNL